MNTRLSLDIGTNSIGWSLISLDENKKPISILKAGTTIVSDTGDNKNRRGKRLARRQIKRRKRRLLALNNAMQILFGNVNFSTYSDDIIELLSKACKEQVNSFELFCVLRWISGNRGYNSNKKVLTAASKKEDGEILKSVNEIDKELVKEKINLAEYLLSKNINRTSIKNTYYSRQSVINLFKDIINKQKEFYLQLDDRAIYGEKDFRNKFMDTIGSGGVKNYLKKFGLYGIIFFQRIFYWDKKTIGRCGLDYKQKRCLKGYREFQEFKTLNDLNNLRIRTNSGASVELTKEQREKLFPNLYSCNLSWGKIRKLLGIKNVFNFEEDGKKALVGVDCDIKISKILVDWNGKSDLEKNSIVKLIVDEKYSELESKFGQDATEELFSLSFAEGRGNYGTKTLSNLLPFLRDGLPLSSNDGNCAIIKAGYGLPWDKKVKIFGKLPSSKEITGNPIVDRIGSSLRILVNKLIDKYGLPSEIAIEMARDLNRTEKQKDEIHSNNKKKQKEREDAAQDIISCGEKITSSKINRYMLWKEQDKVCIYSGKPISISELFSESVNEDHILPYSLTGDDSASNKVICFRSENSDKGQRTVPEWLGKNSEKYKSVISRAENLSYKKRENLVTSEVPDTDFLSNQLPNTRYATVFIANYLKHLGVPIIYFKAGLVAQLRNQLKIKKDRSDHRHHVVDAMILGILNKGIISNLLSRKEIVLPWKSFVKDLEDCKEKMIVYHRTKNKANKKLHDETIFRKEKKKYIDKKTKEEYVKYSRREKIESLTLEKINNIADNQIRNILLKRIGNRKPGKKELLKILQEPVIVGKNHVKRIKISEKRNTIIGLKKKDGEYISCVDPCNIYCVDVIKNSKGKFNFDFVTRLNIKNRIKEKIMSIYPGMYTGIFEGVKKVLVYVKASASSKIAQFVEHTDARVGKDRKFYNVTPANFDKVKLTRLVDSFI